MNMEICQICKEPIWSFLCLDCLADQISGWLPGKVSSKFSKFNKDFIRHFHYRFSGGSSLVCLNCKNPKIASVCMYCYMDEVMDWLRNVNSDLAARLKAMLPSSSIQKIEPITHTRADKTDEGLCEHCETYSDELVSNNGRWVCKECEEIV
jgi:hypothetical protein